MNIPGQIVVEIDPADIPPGPQGASGKSAYQSWLDVGNTGTEADFVQWLRNGQVASGTTIKQSSIAPGANTASTTYVATGLSCTIGVPSGKKVRVEIDGMVNHTKQNIVHFTLMRDATDLTPANHSGLSCSRIDIADGVRAVNIDHLDTPPTGPATYELWWKCHNAGTAYLGRRPSDAAMMVPTTMTLTLVDA